MSLFAKLFRTRAERDFGRMHENASRKTEMAFKPIRRLSLEIVNTSTNCLNQIKAQGLIGTEKNEAEIWQEMFAFFEFLYFFMHMMMRTAFSVLSETELQHLQNHIAPLLATTTVNSWCRHWPEDKKMTLVHDFSSNLNEAEIEYANCSHVDPRLTHEEKSELICQNLFIRLGQRVAGVVGEEANPGTALAVLNIASAEFAKMKLRQYIESFKRDSLSAVVPPYAKFSRR